MKEKKWLVFLKNALLHKALTGLSILSLLMATFSVRSCDFIMYDEEMPENFMKLRNK